MFKPEFKDCTVEVVVLGCRALKSASGSMSSNPTAPFVELDLGTKEGTKTTKVSCAPRVSTHAICCSPLPLLQVFHKAFQWRQ